MVTILKYHPEAEDIMVNPILGELNRNLYYIVKLTYFQPIIMIGGY